MNRSQYKAGPPAPAAVARDGDRSTLVFVRELRHPPEAVYDALTDPQALAQWAPFDSDRNLGQTGNAFLTMAGSSERHPSTVRRAERPTLLEYTWDEDVLRWELESIPGGTRLTLRHTLSDRSFLPKVAAGWHICIDVADLWLAKTPIGRIAGEEALQFGWERLHVAYANTFAESDTPDLTGRGA